jgi:hypothetical protein
MSLVATVIIPTHDHGPTLRYALTSALWQTVDEIEVFVIGDGIAPEGRAIAEEFSVADRRVRFFDNPKGERHGELHRHQALTEARGDYVMYLSDDDLWFTDHVEQLGALLVDADLAHTACVFAEEDEGVFIRPYDVGIERTRRWMLAGNNGVPLSAVGHRLDAYRKLPDGWRTTPLGTPTDLYMWQQFFDQPWPRYAGGDTPTMIHMATAHPSRKDLAPSERCVEIEGWFERLGHPDREAELRRRFAYQSRRDANEITLDHHRLEETVVALRVELDASLQERDHLLGSLAWERERADAEAAEVSRLHARRLRSRLRRIAERVPVVGPRVVARARRLLGRSQV